MTPGAAGSLNMQYEENACSHLQLLSKCAVLRYLRRALFLQMPTDSDTNIGSSSQYQPAHAECGQKGIPFEGGISVVLGQNIPIGDFVAYA